MVKISALLIFLLLYSDLTAQEKSKDTSNISPFGKNKIKNAFQLDLLSDTTGYSKYIWNDKRTISEVMNERSGYSVIDFGTGSRNLIFHNGIYDNRLGLFKDGIQMNDIYFGGFENENFSINEIDRIEEVSNISSFLYGLNTYGKTINVISKDNFISKTFTQLRYSQDRYNSLNADVNFTIPFSNKINFNFGANNNNIDGRYTNSEFSFWRGRTRLNYFISPKLNIKFNFNYSQIQRQLNEGLINSTSDTLSDPILAKIVNPNSYEKIRNYFYDLDLTAKLFNSDESLTKLKIYSSNLMRKYRDDQSGPDPEINRYTFDFHSIQYGIDLKQNYYHTIDKNIALNFLAGYNAYFNLYDNAFTGNFHKAYQSLLSKMDFISERIIISAFGRYNRMDEYYFNYGIESKYNIIRKEDLLFGLKGGFNNTNVPISIITNYLGKIENRYIELGSFAKLSNLYFNFSYYRNQKILSEEDNSDGFNFYSTLESKYFDYYLSIDKFNQVYFPDYFVKSDISYHDYFFNKKLNLRLGFNLKYAYNYEPMTYNQMFYSPASRLNLKVNYFNLDFYIGARIGKANINFTLGNILNSFNYLAYIYPLADTGGALRIISRFTIVWDFLN